MIAPLLVPAAPLAGAALLLVLRSPTLGRWVATIAAGASLTCAAFLPTQLGQDSLTLVDPLSVLFVVSIAAAGIAATLLPTASHAPNRSQALRLALLGLLQLALLSNTLPVTWAALQLAALATALLLGQPGTTDARAASWRHLLITGTGLAIALFGIVVLALSRGADSPDLTWTALAHTAPQLQATLLNLAFIFLLTGLATAALLPLLSARTEPHGPATALLALATSTVALVLILRMRHPLAANPHAIDPGPPIMALGLATLLIATLSLTGQRDARRLFALSTTAQCGVALFAIGLGGPGAAFAGLLHITLTLLSGSALAACVARPASPTLAASLIAMAALPPFGLFASTVLTLSETLRLHPWLALPLGTGIALTTWSLIASLIASLTATAPTRRLPLIPAWIALALSALLGFAMPQPIAAWIAAAASTPP